MWRLRDSPEDSRRCGGWAVIENGPSATQYCKRSGGCRAFLCEGEREKKKTESAFVSCQPAQQKKAVADHSSVFGQIKERQGRKREHRFILSFSVYPFSPQKITSHFVLGGRLLKLSYSPPTSPPQPSMLLCVLVFPVSVYCGPGVSIDNCFYLRLLCTAYNPHTVEVFKPISPLHTHIHLSTKLLFSMTPKEAGERKNGSGYLEVKRDQSGVV